MKKKRLAGICMAAVVLLAGCGTNTNEKVTNKTEPTTAKETQETTTVAPLVIGDNQGTETNSHEGMIKSKLTGEWVDPENGNRRPIAVMLNNIKEAIPQSSIEAADII